VLEDFEKEFLTITVGETTLELLPMGDLPALKVMDMLNTKDDKLEKALSLMMIASKNVKQFEIEREFMSFNELILLIDVWMEQSSKHANKNKKKLLGNNAPKKKVKAVEVEGKTLPEEIIQMIENALDQMFDGDVPDSGETEIELEEDDFLAIEALVRESGLDFGSDTPNEAIIKAAKWFVAHGKEGLLLTKGLLIGPNRNGKYYPVVDGVVKRRLGFTKNEAETEFADEQ
jgi:hypothetical protein